MGKTVCKVLGEPYEEYKGNYNYISTIQIYEGSTDAAFHAAALCLSIVLVVGYNNI